MASMPCSVIMWVKNARHIHFPLSGSLSIFITCVCACRLIITVIIIRFTFQFDPGMASTIANILCRKQVVMATSSSPFALAFDTALSLRSSHLFLRSGFARHDRFSMLVCFPVCFQQFSAIVRGFLNGIGMVGIRFIDNKKEHPCTPAVN